MTGARGARASRPCARRWDPERSGSWRDLPGDGLAAGITVGPAPDDGREQAGSASCVGEEDAAGPEHWHGLVPERLGQALDDAAGALDQLGAGDEETGVQLLQDPVPAPARLGEQAA